MRHVLSGLKRRVPGAARAERAQVACAHVCRAERPHVCACVRVGVGIGVGVGVVVVVVVVMMVVMVALVVVLMAEGVTPVSKLLIQA